MLTQGLCSAAGKRITKGWKRRWVPVTGDLAKGYFDAWMSPESFGQKFRRKYVSVALDVPRIEILSEASPSKSAFITTSILFAKTLVNIVLTNYGAASSGLPMSI